MRFSTITVSALAASLAAASPNSIAKRESQEMTNVIAFAAQQAECSVFDCAAVVAAGLCIAGAIAVPGAVPAVLACVGGGAPSVRDLLPLLVLLYMVEYTNRHRSAPALDASMPSTTSWLRTTSVPSKNSIGPFKSPSMVKEHVEARGSEEQFSSNIKPAVFNVDSGKRLSRATYMYLLGNRSCTLTPQ